MRWFTNLSMLWKLMLTFFLLALISGYIAFEGVNNLQKLHENDIKLYEESVLPMQKLSLIMAKFERANALVRDQIYVSDPLQREEAIEKRRTLSSEIAGLLEQYSQSIVLEEEKTLFQEYIECRKRYTNSISHMENLFGNNQAAEAIAYHQTSIAGIRIEYRDLINKLYEYKVKNSSSIISLNTEMADSSTDIMSIFMIVVVVLSLGLGYVISKSVSTPLSKLAQGAQIIGSGNLSYSDEYLDNRSKFKDEIGKVILAILKMKNNIVDKAYWYEQILDTIPFPISVTDKDMNWTFVNRPVEKLFNAKRDSFTGKQCSNWNAAICKTEKCGVAGLRNGIAQTFFDQFGGNYQVDTSFLYNMNGEKIGHVEVVQDITKMKSMENYLIHSTDKMLVEMEKFAQGDLNVCLQVEKDDSIGKLFHGFNNAIEKVRNVMIKVTEAVQATVSAANEISSSAEEMAAGAHEQSQQTTEVAGAVEEMTKTILETARHSGTAAENSKLASQNARTGATKVEETKKGMLRIVTSTKETRLFNRQN